MRANYVFFVVAATFLASCGAAPVAAESAQTKLSQVAAVVGVLPVMVDSSSKRLLRTAETAVAVEDDEYEERAFDFLKKLITQRYIGKVVRKDGKTFSNNYVKALLKRKGLREKTFLDWAKSDLDGKVLKESLGGLTDKDRIELFNRYTAFTGELVRKAGNRFY